jgi:hypothetical protein
LNARVSAVVGVSRKGECRGSQGACAPWDGLSWFRLRRDRALQGRATPRGAASAVLAGV